MLIISLEWSLNECNILDKYAHLNMTWILLCAAKSLYAMHTTHSYFCIWIYWTRVFVFFVKCIEYVSNGSHGQWSIRNSPFFLCCKPSWYGMIYHCTVHFCAIFFSVTLWESLNQTEPVIIEFEWETILNCKKLFVQMTKHLYCGLF